MYQRADHNILLIFRRPQVGPQYSGHRQTQTPPDSGNLYFFYRGEDVNLICQDGG